jgi:hypothetical protein
MNKSKNPKVLQPLVGLSATQRKSIGAGVYVKRERHPDEALPLTFTTRGEKLDVPRMDPVRPGASDHKFIKSKGFSC